MPGCVERPNNTGDHDPTETPHDQASATASIVAACRKFRHSVRARSISDSSRTVPLSVDALPSISGFPVNGHPPSIPASLGWTTSTEAAVEIPCDGADQEARVVFDFQTTAGADLLLSHRALIEDEV